MTRRRRFHLVLIVSQVISYIDNVAGESQWLSSSSPRPDEKTLPLLPHDSAITTRRMKTLLCVDHGCSDDCVTYETPLNTCFNGEILFPNDPAWGKYDIFDRPMKDGSDTQFHRYFFTTTDGTCEGNSQKDPPSDDIYTLPLEECVGPFGEPRPWGSFEFVTDPMDSSLLRGSIEKR
eukprot:scaffold155359_cov52-Attheya_sp.AAC.2